MDTSDQFQRTEQEYNRLKESLAAGEITQEQFAAQAKQLVAQDAQGQYWSIGENGYWVKREGPPPRPRADTATASPAPPPPRASRLPLPLVAGVAALCIVLLCGVGAAGLFVRSNLLGPSVALAPTLSPTPTLLPALAPTDVPAPTDAAVPTGTPAPTLTAQAATVTATTAASATLPIPATAAVAVAPGIYVTGVRLDPPTPARKQDVQFFVSFLNTTNAAVNVRGVVFIFKTDNMKSALGQTTDAGLSLPVGASEQKLSGWKLTGGGGCENFLAQVASIEGKKVTYINGTNGQLFQLPLTVC